MIQYPTVVLGESDIQLAKDKAAELVEFFRPRIIKNQKSGSHIQDVEQRLKRLERDQLTGQLAQLGGTIYLTGSDNMYRIQRWNCMRTPERGDGGYDILGLTLDFKGSRLRPNWKPTQYLLPIRQNERKEGWTYSLVVVNYTKGEAHCHIMGWVSDTELEGKYQKDGQFAGAYTVPNNELHPFPNMRWEL